jgi:hypothetical protein
MESLGDDRERKQQEGGEAYGHQPGDKHRGRDVLQGLGGQESVQWRLVIPNLRVQPVAFQTQRGLGELKSFVGSNLYCGAQRQRACYEEQKDDREAQEQTGENRRAAGPALRVPLAVLPVEERCGGWSGSTLSPEHGKGLPESWRACQPKVAQRI